MKIKYAVKDVDTGEYFSCIGRGAAFIWYPSAFNTDIDTATTYNTKSPATLFIRGYTDYTNEVLGYTHPIPQPPIARNLAVVDIAIHSQDI